MTLTRTGRNTIAAVVLTLLAAGVATEVATAGRLKTRSATETVPDKQHGAAKAVCPKGTKAVSGGFKTEFFGIDLDFPFIPIEASRRTRSRGWTSWVQRRDRRGRSDLFRLLPQAEAQGRHGYGSAPVGEFVTATATCPAGTKIVSGGFEASPVDTVGTTPVLYVSEARRATKRRWEASAFSNGNEHGDLKAAAYCAKGKTPKARHASTTLDSATPSAKVIARCKRRERRLGGLRNPDDSGEATPRFLASKRRKRRWAVSAYYGDNGGPIAITAYAYCERKRKRTHKWSGFGWFVGSPIGAPSSRKGHPPCGTR